MGVVYISNFLTSNIFSPFKIDFKRLTSKSYSSAFGQFSKLDLLGIEFFFNFKNWLKVDSYDFYLSLY
jgi:hypothetical protein